MGEEKFSLDDGKRQTLVKWNCKGSSVLRLTFNPVLKKLGKGFLSYVKKSALLDNGDIAIYEHRQTKTPSVTFVEPSRQERKGTTPQFVSNRKDIGVPELFSTRFHERLNGKLRKRKSNDRCLLLLQHGVVTRMCLKTSGLQLALKGRVETTDKEGDETESTSMSPIVQGSHIGEKIV